MKITNYKSQMTNSRRLLPIASREEGITLIIAIVLLAVITFISFSLSAVIIREIRTTQDILKTEPAISGAGSGGEIGLYHFLRETGEIDSSDGSTPQSNASFDISSDFYDDPYEFTIESSGAINVYLYDAEQPTNQSTGYTSVTIVNTGSNPLRVQVASWSDLETNLCSTTVAVGDQDTCSALNQVDDRYRVSIENLSASGEASGQVSASPLGIPSTNPGFEVVGTKDGVRRKLQVSF